MWWDGRVFRAILVVAEVPMTFFGAGAMVEKRRAGEHKLLLLCNADTTNQREIRSFGTTNSKKGES